MATNYRKRITIDPKIMVGKPVITGTRVPVYLILKKLAQNMEMEEILKDYPRLTREDIKAAIWYAADSLGNENAYTWEMA